MAEPKDTKPHAGTQNLIQNHPHKKRHVYRPGMRIKNINLQKEKKRLLNILHRDIEKLLRLSVDDKNRLSKDDSAALRDYLRLIKDFEKKEASDEAGMTDEQLAKLAGGE